MVDTLMHLWPADFAKHKAVAIPDGGPNVTYAGLTEQIQQVAAALRRGGVRPGDPVAIVLPNGLEFLVAFLAVTWVRGIAAPLNPAYKAEEFRFYMEDAGVRAVLVPPGDHPARDAAAHLQLPLWEVSRQDGAVHVERLGGNAPAVTQEQSPFAQDVALFLHTSGTTQVDQHDAPAPVVQGFRVEGRFFVGGSFDWLRPFSVLTAISLVLGYGLLGATLSTLHTGGTVIIPPRFSGSTFWQHAAAHRATWYSAVPTIHQVLLARADADQAPRQGLRFIRSCSAALAPAVFQQLEDRFAAPVLEAYGMTEASHQMSSNPLPPAKRKPGSVGQGTGVDIAIFDDGGNPLLPGRQGEVCIRGANLMYGYNNNPEANAAAFTGGYFRTGDQGVFDSDGYLTLTGRLKELINRGGEKISPLEVDAVATCRIPQRGRSLSVLGAVQHDELAMHFHYGGVERSCGFEAASLWRQDRHRRKPGPGAERWHEDSAKGCEDEEQNRAQARRARKRLKSSSHVALPPGPGLFPPFWSRLAQ